MGTEMFSVRSAKNCGGATGFWENGRGLQILGIHMQFRRKIDDEIRLDDAEAYKEALCLPLRAASMKSCLLVFNRIHLMVSVIFRMDARNFPSRVVRFRSESPHEREHTV